MNVRMVSAIFVKGKKGAVYRIWRYSEYSKRKNGLVSVADIFRIVLEK